MWLTKFGLNKGLVTIIGPVTKQKESSFVCLLLTNSIQENNIVKQPDFVVLTGDIEVGFV